MGVGVYRFVTQSQDPEPVSTRREHTEYVYTYFFRGGGTRGTRLSADTNTRARVRAVGARIKTLRPRRAVYRPGGRRG